MRCRSPCSTARAGAGSRRTLTSAHGAGTPSRHAVKLEVARSVARKAPILVEPIVPGLVGEGAHRPRLDQ
jgi:hypothetical protein